MKPKLLLIDGDLYAYLYAAAAEEGYDWGEGIHSLAADASTAFSNMSAEIKHTLVTLKADRLVVCLSDDRNFRKELVYPEYKSNRKDVRKPMVLKDLRKRMEAEFDVKTKPMLEADDVMGIMATNPKVFPEYDKIIVSRDKDMLTVPGVLWQGKFDDKGNPLLSYTSEEDANRTHLIQTLTGDVADGYPGARGVGPVKAKKIVEDGWKGVVKAFEKTGCENPEQTALQQARCARILRAEDFNYKTQEPILWVPK